MLHHCDEHVQSDKEKEKEKEENKDDKDKEENKDEPKVDDTFQAFAVLGIALIAMGEDIGAEMSLRQFNHLVGFGAEMSMAIQPPHRSIYFYGEDATNSYLTDALLQPYHPQNGTSCPGPCQRLESCFPRSQHPL